MDGSLLVYGAAVAVAFWGVAHLIPTSSVVAGFGRISNDNRRLLTMEWVAEGMTLIFVGVLVAAVTLAGGADDDVGVAVYWTSAGLLAAIAVLTTFTGARTPVAWFKACPVVLGACIALLVIGGIL
ncbi:MAG TPA: hypothetical protein VFL41_04750 [Gaiellaceae bacterium]|nr:hypothetical protein [Gaiellaceae bacterium]HET8653302.1 hypothetical protein [Gaiellaceae bacterium]